MPVGDRFRSTRDGQIGFLDLDDDGSTVIRLDRPAERRLVPYNERDWVPDVGPRLTPLAMASVCYEADARLRMVAEATYTVPHWIGLKDVQRTPWLRGLPAGASEMRQRVRAAIMRELEKG